MYLSFFGRSAIYVGRPAFFHYGTLYDMTIDIGIGRRKNPGDGTPHWRKRIRISWNWLPDRIYKRDPYPSPRWRDEFVYSVTWTGRETRFLGFGRWRRIVETLTARGSEKMKVFVTGDKERNSPHHELHVIPANVMRPDKVTKELPSWTKNPDGTPKLFQIVFVYGRAEVESDLGNWLLAVGHCSDTALVKVQGSSLLGSLAQRLRLTPRPQTQF